MLRYTHVQYVLQTGISLAGGSKLQLEVIMDNIREATPIQNPEDYDQS